MGFSSWGVWFFSVLVEVWLVVGWSGVHGGCTWLFRRQCKAAMQGSVAEDVCAVLDMNQTWCIMSAPGWLLQAAHGAFARSCIPNEDGHSLRLQQAVFRCAT